MYHNDADIYSIVSKLIRGLQVEDDTEVHVTDVLNLDQGSHTLSGHLFSQLFSISTWKALNNSLQGQRLNLVDWSQQVVS